jgi:hypothetical protein
MSEVRKLRALRSFYFLICYAHTASSNDTRSTAMSSKQRLLRACCLQHYELADVMMSLA